MSTMYEFRWFKTKECLTPHPKLQYRQRLHFSEIDGLIYWSAWTDVPTVYEDVTKIPSNEHI